MYQVGDLIVYGHSGVCVVSEIKTIDAPWADKDQLYYALEPAHGDYVVYAPVDSCKVFTRLAISKDEANRLIDTIPSIEPKIHHSLRPQDMAAYYTSYIESHDCADLIELTMSLYAKKRHTGRHHGEVRFGRPEVHGAGRAVTLRRAGRRAGYSARRGAGLHRVAGRRLEARLSEQGGGVEERNSGPQSALGGGIARPRSHQ